MGVSIDDPAVLNFVSLPGEEEALTDVPRVETIAARLAAIYSDVDDVDPFVGMISEPHLPGKSFGALQNAVWEAEFLALRVIHVDSPLTCSREVTGLSSAGPLSVESHP